mgnify:CR=1 FL=1
MLDLLIANGMIVDGTGNPGFYGAIAVEGETVRVLRGDVSQIQAARTIDATGHVVSPGFIDMHAHTGLVILAEPHHEPKIRQGITTELVVVGTHYRGGFARLTLGSTAEAVIRSAPCSVLVVRLAADRPSR